MHNGALRYIKALTATVDIVQSPHLWSVKAEKKKVTPWARIIIFCWRHLGEERVLYSNVNFPKLWQYGTILYSSVGKSHSQQEDFRAIDLLGFRPFFLPTMPIVFLSRCLLFSHGAGKISTSIKSGHFFLYFSRQYIIYYILYRRGLLSKHNTRWLNNTFQWKALKESTL